MLVLIFPILESGTILNGISRKVSLMQTLFTTWILMLQRVNMLINYLMIKYLQNCHANSIKITFQGEKKIC